MSFNDEGNGASDSSLANYKVLRVGDIAFEGHQNKTYPYGRFVLNDVGTGIMSPRFTCLRPKTEQVIEFWKYYINDEYVMNRILVFATKAGTMMNELVIDDFNQQCVHVPAEQEQTAIGRLFTALDSLIAAEQRKLNLLDKYKDALLGALFPEVGEDRPKKRFKGFALPWETQSFSQVFDFLQNNTLSRAELHTDTGIAKVIHYGDILTKLNTCLDVENTNLPYTNDLAIATKYENSFLRDGDLVFADTAEDTTTGKCIELRDTRNNHVLAGLHTMPCRPRRTFSCGFLGYCLSSQVYRKQLIPLMQGIKVISISRTALQQTVIPIPQIEEQDRIGKLFLVLDSLIAAVKHKIELLELKKRALLQQMFV